MDGKEITDILSNVKDSYFNKDLITLGYIKGMSIGDKELRFTLRLPAPLMPNHEELAQKCREALKDVEGLETIDFGTFNGTALETIIIPSSVKKIGRYALAYCKNLKSIELPEGLEEIENGAFYITKREHLLKNRLRYSGRIGNIDIPLKRSFQIDTQDELDLIRSIIKNGVHFD